MSDVRWIKSLVGGLVIVIVAIGSSKGNSDECSLCCILQGTREDLNCTWTKNTTSQLSGLLQSISNPHNFPQHCGIPSGQNWLLIPRENLTLYHKYQLSVSGGPWMETVNFTYCHGCENVFIGAPLLNSSVYEEDTLVVIVTWKHIKEHSYPPVVELRYRILGASTWILVHSSDLEPDCYQMTDPGPDTDYEFQIRYIPDEQQKSRGLWSESYVLTTPEEVPVGTLDIWRRVDQENSLLVAWKPLSHHSARGKILSYNVTYICNNTHQTTEEPCCSITLPAQSTEVCVSARNSMGLGAHSWATPLCSVAADMGDSGGKAWEDPSERVAVWWEKSMNYGFPVDYLVEWRKDNSSEMDWTRNHTANQTLVLPGKFLPGVLYLISVYALYNDNCVKVFSTEAYGREEVPLAGPTYSIENISSSEVSISWDEIPKHNLRGKLKNYTVYVNSTTDIQRHTVYGRNITISRLRPGTTYHIFITASTAAGEGVPSASKTFHTKGVRELHQLLLPCVSVMSVAVLLFICFYAQKPLFLALWPKIPKPENKLNGLANSSEYWESQQLPPNPPFTEVEEIQLVSPPSPPPAPLPEPRRAVTYGYEKHFMPTPEEVMASC